MSYLKDNEIYARLAANTTASLQEALDGCAPSMEGIVYRAIAKSPYATPEMMKRMLHNTEYGFTKLEKNYGTGEMIEISSSPRRDEYRVGDIHNFRSEAVARIKEFVKSPAIVGNEVDTAELLYKIAANIPGNPRDVLDVYKTAVKSSHANNTTFGYAVHRTAFLLSGQKDEAARKDYAKDALEVFAAVANSQNAYKLDGETLTDFYHAIKSFAPYEPKRVTELVNKMKQLGTNTYKSLAMANSALATVTKSKIAAQRT